MNNNKIIVAVINILFVMLISIKAQINPWDNSIDYKEQDSVSYLNFNNEDCIWTNLWWASPQNIPGSCIDSFELLSSPWYLINSKSIRDNASFQWRGWNGDLENNINLEATVPTWRDGAEGAYSIIHEGVGLRDWDKGFASIIDTLKKYDKIKASFSVITNLINSQGWNNLRSTLKQGHEIISNSHDNSLVYSSWKTFYHGDTIPSDDLNIPEEIRGFVVDTLLSTYTNINLKIPFTNYVNGDILQPYNDSSTFGVYGIDNNAWLIKSNCVTFNENVGPNGSMVQALKIPVSVEWDNLRLKANIQGSKKILDDNLYIPLLDSINNFFPPEKRCEYFLFPENMSFFKHRDSLENYGYIGSMGRLIYHNIFNSLRKITFLSNADFYHPYDLAFDNFYQVNDLGDISIPDNPFQVSGLNELVDTIIHQKKYCIRNLGSVVSTNWENVKDSSLGGMNNSISSSLYSSHVQYVQSKVDSHQLAIYTASEVVKYRFTSNAVDSIKIIKNMDEYSLIPYTRDIDDKYKDEISIIVTFDQSMDSLVVEYVNEDVLWGKYPRRRPRKMDLDGKNWSVNIQPFLGEVKLTPNGFWPDNICPDDVSNLSIIGQTDTTVNISWNSSISLDADSILIVWDTLSLGNMTASESITGKSTFKKIVSSLTSDIIYGLSENTEYFIKLFVMDKSKNWSDGVQVIAKTKIADIIPPENVTNVSAVSSTTSSIDVSWTASISTDVDSLLIAWGTDSITVINDAKVNVHRVVPLDSTSFIIGGLNQNTEYHIKIFANDSAGNWNSGVAAYAKTLQVITDDLTPPLNVTNLVVIDSTTSSISVGWNKSVDLDVDYQLLAWSTTSIGDFSDAVNRDTISLSKTVIAHAIENLDHSTNYYIKIFAIDTAENKNSGVEILGSTKAKDVTPPDDVILLKIDSTSEDNINISWDYVKPDDINMVLVSWSTGSIGDIEDGKTKLNFYVDPKESNYEIKELLHNTTYNIKIFVSDSLNNWSAGVGLIGKTDESSSVDSIAPVDVTDLTAIAKSHSEISLTWSTSISEDASSLLVAWSEDSISDVTDAMSKVKAELLNTEESYKILNLNENTTYYIKMFVVDTINNWSNGVEIKVKTDENISEDSTKPDAVTSLLASAKSDTEINLSWVSSISEDVDTILVAWSESNIVNVSDALNKGHFYLDQNITSFTITSLKKNTFYNIKIFVQDTADWWSQGASATAKTDNETPVEILAGDFNNDEIIDILDFSYVSEYWTKTVNKDVDSIQELAPYYGDLPLITVDPDGEFNYRDLSVFTSACHLYYDTHRSDNNRNVNILKIDSSVFVNVNIISDQLSISLNSEHINNITAASFKVYSPSQNMKFQEISGEQILGLDKNDALIFINDDKGFTQIFSTILGNIDRSRNTKELIRLVFNSANLRLENVIIEYEFVNDEKEVFIRGSQKIDVSNLKSDDNTKKIIVVPNPSSVVSESRKESIVITNFLSINNKEGFFFDFEDFKESYLISIVIYDLLGNVINEKNINQSGTSLDGKMIYWNGYNKHDRSVSSGLYKLVLTYKDDYQQNKISVLSIGVKE